MGLEAVGVGTLLTMALWGGLVGLDAVSWPQAMISRPLVAGTLGGWLLGAPEAGLLVGAVLEALFLRHLPFGAARGPETGPAGLVAGAAYAALGSAGSAALAGAIAAGWGVAWAGAWTVTRLRRLNGRLFPPEGVEGLSEDPRRLERRHRLGLVLDYLRGAVLTSVVFVPAVLSVRVAGATASGPASVAAAGAVALGIGAALGSGARGTSAEGNGRVAFSVGVVGGIITLLVVP